MKLFLSISFFSLSFVLLIPTAYAVNYSDDPNAAQECTNAGQDYNAAVNFVQQLQQVITKSDASAFSQLVIYPLVVNYGQVKITTVKIQTPQELKSQYSQFLTPSMKRDILIDPDLECTEDGVMIYAGIIWFTTNSISPKITVINVQPN